MAKGFEPRLGQRTGPLHSFEFLVSKVQRQIVANTSANSAGDIGFNAEWNRGVDGGQLQGGGLDRNDRILAGCQSRRPYRAI